MLKIVINIKISSVINLFFSQLTYQTLAMVYKVKVELMDAKN